MLWRPTQFLALTWCCVALLATETRAWLHVNKYGMALARPVDGSKPPPNDGADGEVKASWRSM